MQKVVLFTFFIFILITACRKDSNTAAPTYYVKATIDGTPQTFNKNAKASEFYGDFTNALTLSADNSGDPVNNSPAISLILSHKYAPVTAGIYMQGFYDTANVYSISGTYESYKAGFNNQANPPLKITITQINNQTITGAFEGEYLDTTLTKPLVIITDGEFYLPFK